LNFHSEGKHKFEFSGELLRENSKQGDTSGMGNGLCGTTLQYICVTLRHCSLSVFIKVKSPWSLRLRHQAWSGSENRTALSPLQRGSHSHWTTFNKHRRWVLSENIGQVHYTKICIYLGVTAPCDKPNNAESLLRS